ncbi:MAG: hypothetical protein M1834_004284 [Cirrosporium novae-zelandiae]|nr:MAG: hypothetical protein M1834_004284 [Cirrosporium novae-zelandiae]
MYRIRLKCNICGVEVGAGYHCWIDEFRAVYTKGYEWSNPRISGVGSRRNIYSSTVLAPQDFGVRFDDPGFSRPSSLDIHSYLCMDQSAVLDESHYWGFIFHDSCWQLLNAACYPRQVSAQVLYDFCRSCPGINWVINWGHNYGILDVSNAKKVLPVFEGFLLEEYERVSELRATVTGAFYLADPFHWPILGEIVEGALHERGDLIIQKQPISVAYVDRDRFAKLPPEVREIVIINLPYKDVKNLRARVWDVVQPLADALNPFADVRLCGTPSPTFYDPDFTEAISEWRCVGGNVREDKRSLLFGCRTLFSRTVNVPSKLAAVCVSIIWFYDVHYITGLRFVEEGGDIVDMGYILSDDMITLEIKDLSGGESSNHLRGFQLGIGPRGIQAIALVTGDGRVSKWVGRPQNLLRTRLLSGGQHIKELKGNFDGFKMVSLGVPDNDRNDYSDGSDNLGFQSIRDTFPWFPEIPDVNLDLNEDSFQDQFRIFPSTPTYSPLMFLHFGGPQGIHLGNIISLSLWVIDAYQRPMGIEIEYNKEVEGKKIHQLGCCGPFDDDNDNDDNNNKPRGTQDGIADQKVTFPIDGPGGERINRVDVQKVNYRRQLCFQVSKKT